jgi:hypothetical protein
MVMVLLLNESIRKVHPRAGQKLNYNLRKEWDARARMVKSKLNDVKVITAKVESALRSIAQLRDDFNVLVPLYSDYFKEVKQQSANFMDYLKTWSEIEKKMPVQLNKDQKQALQETGMLFKEVIIAAPAVMQDFARKKDSLFSFDSKFKDCTDFITKNMPDTELCIKEAEKLNGIYLSELNNYRELKKQLPHLNDQLSRLMLMFSKLKD